MQYTGARSKNEKIRRIQEQVHRIKSSEEMGVRYMQEWEEKALIREKAMEQGIDKMKRLTKMLLEQGRTEDLLRATTDMEYQEKLFEELNICE